MGGAARGRPGPLPPAARTRSRANLPLAASAEMPSSSPMAFHLGPCSATSRTSSAFSSWLKRVTFACEAGSGPGSVRGITVGGEGATRLAASSVPLAPLLPLLVQATCRRRRRAPAVALVLPTGVHGDLARWPPRAHVRDDAAGTTLLTHQDARVVPYRVVLEDPHFGVTRIVPTRRPPLALHVHVSRSKHLLQRVRCCGARRHRRRERSRARARCARFLIPCCRFDSTICT